MAHVITGLDIGGAELYLRRLTSRGREDLCAIVVSLTTMGALGREIEDEGIPVYHLDVESPWNLVGAVRRFRNILSSERINVVQSWMYKADMFASIANLGMGLPLAWSVRQSNISRRYNRMGTVLLIRILALLSHLVPTTIVYCAHESRKVHEKAGYRKSIGTVIVNGVDTTRFFRSAERRARARRELGIPEDAPVVGFIGRDDPQKRLPMFIECARRIAEQDNRVRFVLVGRGVDRFRDEVNRKIEGVDLAERMILVGEHRSIEVLVNALDVFLSCSIGEGWPNALAEAMASGVVCVATDVGDSSDIVGDAGFVHGPEDSSELVESVLTVVRMEKPEYDRFSSSSVDRIRQGFSIDKSAMVYSQLYDSLRARMCYS